MRYKPPWRIFLAPALLFPAALQPQMPPQPGRLVILSEPPGATVTINQKTVTQKTNASLVVSPGTYTVTVTSPNPKFSCQKTVAVSSGQTVTSDCTATGWKS